jgi:sortase A
MKKPWITTAARGIAFALSGGGVVALAFGLALLTGGWIAQRRASDDLGRRIQVRAPREDVADGSTLGQIEIARLGISSIVMEGSDATTLRRGVGHIQGTAFPGRSGNVGLAGHRDTVFRALRNVRPDDVITLRSPLGEYHYRVVSTGTVAPTAVEVLLPTPEESVTLVTCYPFYYVGPAPERFIVRAVRITTGD